MTDQTPGEGQASPDPSQPGWAAPGQTPPPVPPGGWQAPPPPGGGLPQPPPAAWPQQPPAAWPAPPPGPPGWGPPPPGPPGAAPYGPGAYAGAPGAPWGVAPPRPSSLQGLRIALLVLLGVAGLAAVVAAARLFERARLVDDYADGRGVSIFDVDQSDKRVAGVVGLLGLLLLVTGIVWIVWQVRHANNAKLLGQRQGLGSGWAIGGWFVPIGSLWLPLQQLWGSSKASDPAFDPDVPSSGRAEPLLLPWWIAFQAGWVLFWVGRIMRPSDADLITGDRSIGDFANADRIVGVSCIVLVAAAVLAAFVVTRVTRRQSARLQAAGWR